MKGNPMHMITDMDPYIPPKSLWTDGGLLSRNPSKIGGTWAWVRVNEKLEIENQSSGILLPKHLNTEARVYTEVTNSHSEITAIYRGLRELPDDWIGEIVTDSKLCISWLTQKDRLGERLVWKNCPDWLQERVIQEQNRIYGSGGHLKYRHVDGHQNDSIDHRFNILCDDMCRKEGEDYKERHGIVATTTKRIPKEKGAKVDPVQAPRPDPWRDRVRQHRRKGPMDYPPNNGGRRAHS